MSKQYYEVSCQNWYGAKWESTRSYSKPLSSLEKAEKEIETEKWYVGVKREEFFKRKNKIITYKKY